MHLVASHASLHQSLVTYMAQCASHNSTNRYHLGAYALKYSGGKWVFVPSFTVAVLSFLVNIISWKRLVPRASPDAPNITVKINE